MKNIKLLLKIIIVIVLIILAFVILQTSFTATEIISENADESNIACTMDAMQCPDGSYVGRSGPKCEFVCPK
jgi:hypothetical protein